MWVPWYTKRHFDAIFYNYFDWKSLEEVLDAISPYVFDDFANHIYAYMKKNKATLQSGIIKWNEIEFHYLHSYIKSLAGDDVYDELWNLRFNTFIFWLIRDLYKQKLEQKDMLPKTSSRLPPN